MAEEIINRDAGDKQKGPRLQRLRVVSLMLDAIEVSEKPFIYGATEHKEDLYLNNPNSGELFEQNKNYAPGTNFTFNSNQVIKTMVSFMDIWIEWSMSEKNVFLGYYTTANIGTESETEFIKSNGIELPDQPILKLLSEHNIDHPKLLKCVKELVTAEYLEQYKGAKKGNIEIVKKFSDEDWKKFLRCINWKFGEDDEEELKKKILEKIKKCRFYNQSGKGKEGAILSELLELFDERQKYSDLTEKFVHGADIQVKFLEACAGVKDKSEDPVWKMWEAMPKPLDKRNLIDKIRNVCAGYNEAKLQNLSRVVCRSLMEKSQFESDKSFLAARYRVYERCKTELDKLLASGDAVQELTEVEINTIVSQLYAIGKAELDDGAQEFKYRYMTGSVIEGVILELFESCYLAFDRN